MRNSSGNQNLKRRWEEREQKEKIIKNQRVMEMCLLTNGSSRKRGQREWREESFKN